MRLPPGLSSIFSGEQFADRETRSGGVPGGQACDAGNVAARGRDRLARRVAGASQPLALRVPGTSGQRTLASAFQIGSAELR